MASIAPKPPGTSSTSQDGIAARSASCAEDQPLGLNIAAAERSDHHLGVRGADEHLVGSREVKVGDAGIEGDDDAQLGHGWVLRRDAGRGAGLASGRKDHDPMDPTISRCVAVVIFPQSSR